MRFLSLFFNPFGNLIWWIVKTVFGGIDRRLGPLVGWLLAWALVLLSAISLLGAVYATSDNSLKLSGMRARELVTIAEGRVISAQTIRRKTLTVEQSIVAEFEGDGGPRRHEGNVNEPVSDEYAPGDVIEVYVTQDGTPSFRNPEDPFLDTVLVVAGLGIPLIALVFSLKYLRHRKRFLTKAEPIQASVVRVDGRGAGPSSRSDVVVRGGQRVESYAERQKEDADRIRRMREKADQQKR